MKATFSISQKIIRKLVIVISIFISMSAMSCNYAEKLFPQVTPEEVQEVKNICDNIKPPPSFIKKDEVFTVKEGLVLHSTQYSSTESREGIESYFVNLLTQPGWKYQKDSEGYGYRLLFKKGKITISGEIDPPNFINSKVYSSVDCSIGL